MWNPDTIAKLQYAAQANHYGSYQQFAAFADGLSEKLCTIRGLLEFKPLDEPIDTGRGRAGQRDSQAVRHRRNLARFHQP